MEASCEHPDFVAIRLSTIFYISPIFLNMHTAVDRFTVKVREPWTLETNSTQYFHHIYHTQDY